MIYLFVFYIMNIVIIIIIIAIIGYHNNNNSIMQCDRLLEGKKSLSAGVTDSTDLL